MTDDKPTYQDLEQRISLLEQELHEKNKRLSLLASNFDEIQELAKTGHWELDVIQNKLYWSDEIYRIFECSPHEFEATYEVFLSFIHPEDLDYVNISYQNHLISRTPYNIIHRLLLKDGSIKFVNERCKSDFDSNGNPLRSTGIVVDITDNIQIKNELKLAHKKAGESERNIQDITSNFETFFNTIDDFLFVIDEQGNILHSNKTVEKRLGYTAEELKGKSILSVHPKEQRSEIEKVLADVIAGRLASFQIPLVSKDGKQIDVETHANAGSWNGKPAFYGVAKDITKLRLSEEKFARLFRSSPDSIILSRLSDGIIIEINDSTCINLGYTKDELIGHSTLQLNIWVNPEERGCYVELLEKNQRVNNFEAKFRMKSGQIKVGLMSSEIIELFNDVYILGITRDITDRKLAEDALIKKNTDYQFLNKEYEAINKELTESIERIRDINSKLEEARQIAEENEQKFSIAFHSSPNVSMITNIETGIILEANDAVEQVAGYARTEIIGNSAISLNLWMVEGSRKKFIEMLVRDKRVLNYESEFRKKSGEAFVGLISGQMIQIKNQNCILSVIHDITDRKNAEIGLLKAKEKIEESEEKFKNLYESLSISYLTLKDGICIECNQATLSIYRAESKNEIIGKSPVDFSPEFQLNQLKSSEEAERQNQTAIEKGFHTFEWLAMRKDKEMFYAEISLKPYYYKNELYIQCLTTDITERKNAEIELLKAKEKVEESEIKFRQLAENLNDVVWLRKGDVIAYINPAFEEMYGISREAFYKDSKILYNAMHPDDVQKYQEALHTKEFIETGKFYCEYRIIRPNNDVRWIISKSSPIMDTKGNKTPYRVGIAIDITKLKNIENELIAAKEKAEESDRLKTAFLHNMSHEIRTPLNAISGFTGLLNDPEITEEELNYYIQIIQNNSTQLVAIVSDILTISSLETKQEPISISNVCINDLLAELQAIFNQKAEEKKISLCVKKQLTNDQSGIFTDKTKITQVISNLLTNALKFTHEGFVEFGYELKNNYLEFYVKDSGIGIKPEFQDKIFERFRQANQSINKLYGGTGLGLAISKAYIELLGGKIWVQSEVEKGSTFYFTLPYNPSKRN